jgi:aminoglycoside phosphotransferase family enzyme/predicted kinase
MNHPPIVTAMLDSSFYPEHPKQIEFIETHISYIFIAGNFVYKVKKAVRFDFLDFTSLEKRKFYCEEELRLNRRLAPNTYLDVIEISKDAKGKIILGHGHEIMDYAVKMKKLPEDKMLKNLLAAGMVNEQTMDKIAETIASFHRHAETGKHITDQENMDNIRRNCEENFRETMNAMNITIPDYQYHFIKDFTQKTLTEKEDLFGKRIREQKIRECHGDLHLDHICVADEIIIFDCIEFNERFRYGDVAEDVAFLTMDLDFNGYPQWSEKFTQAYIRYSGDIDLLQLLNFYRCYYAYVRGKVISLRFSQNQIAGKKRDEDVKLARQYFQLAYRYATRLEKPALILISGLMGSGKSYQAKILAESLGTEILRTDVLRKEIFNIPPTQHRNEPFGEGIYSTENSQIVYEKIFQLSEKLIRQNKAVIIDASFKKREQRIKAMQLAANLGVRFYILECTCPENIIYQRLKKRALKDNSVSDGRWDLFQAQKDDFEPINEIPPEHYLKIDTATHPEAMRQKIIEKIKMEE